MKNILSRNSFIREKAQGLVEFSLVLPLLLMLTFGIIEFGRLLFVYAAVTTSSREAARYGSAGGDNGSGTLRYEDCSGIIAAANRVGILANITWVGISYDSGPGTAPVVGCPPGSIEIEGGRTRIVVNVNANYQPLVPLVNIGPFTFGSESARTIFSDIEVGRYPPNPAHIADLEGSASGSSAWDASVLLLVMDEEGDVVENATVSGGWSWANKSGSCATTASGTCTITLTGIPNGQKSITLTITDIIHVEKAYDPLANSDLDGDSDGTEICINKPGQNGCPP